VRAGISTITEHLPKIEGLEPKQPGIL